MIPLTLGTLAFAAWSARAFLIPVVQSRIVWGVASMILILTFTSGYMWNKIKNAPYVHVNQEGHVSWFAGGYQNQLGLESQVVAGMCEYILPSTQTTSPVIERRADKLGQMEFSALSLSP